MSMSTNPLVAFTSCFQPPDPSICPLEATYERQLTYLPETVTWQVYPPDSEFSAPDLQKVIDTIANEMERRMAFGHGIGRCVLLASQSLLWRKMHGCLKITQQGCIELQSYIRDRLKGLSATCHKAIQAWERHCTKNGTCELLEKGPVDACRELSLPDSDRLTAGQVLWFDELEREDLCASANTAAKHLFFSSYDSTLLVQGREPECNFPSSTTYVLANE